MQWNKKQMGLKGLMIALVVLLSSCTQERQSLEIDPIIASQTALYPGMKAQDWYKLFHQASMGNRHLGVDDSLIYAYLLGEWDRIEASDTEPLLEYIAPDSSVVRLNLRPFKADGGTPDEVFDSMKKTWDAFTPSEQQLSSYLSELQQASQQNKVEISEETLTSFIEQKRQEGYPAVHHSPEYEASFKPAYRVLERRFIP